MTQEEVMHQCCLDDEDFNLLYDRLRLFVKDYGTDAIEKVLEFISDEMLENGE